LSDYQPAVLVSAKTGEGIGRLKELLADLLPEPFVTRRFSLGLHEGGLLSQSHQLGSVSEVEYLEDGIRGVVVLTKPDAEKYRDYLSKEPD